MKKQMKKLVLAKETVQNLEAGDNLKQVLGGGFWDTEAVGCYSTPGASRCPTRLC